MNAAAESGRMYTSLFKSLWEWDPVRKDGFHIRKENENNNKGESVNKANPGF